MSIKTDIRTPIQTLNYMKYVEIENDSRFPAVTGGSEQGIFNHSAVLVRNVDSIAASNIPIAAGEVPGYSHINKFGYNDEIPTTFELITTPSTNIVYPTTAAVVSVVSDDANDDFPSGTGARTVSIQGLDADYNLQSDTLELDGTNAVTTTNTYIRVFRAGVETAGSSGGAEGTISFSIGGNVQCTIDPEYDNQTLHAAYTIPAGKTGYLTRLQVTSTKDNKAGMVGFFQREFGTDKVFKVKQLIEVYRNSVVVDFPVPLKLTEKSDLELRGKNLNSGNISLGGTFDLILVDN